MTSLEQLRLVEAILLDGIPLWSSPGRPPHAAVSPQDEVSLSGYRKYQVSQAAPLPLTAAEEELRQIKLNEVHTQTHTYTFKQTLQTLTTKTQPDALVPSPTVQSILTDQYC